jgi:serine/threonine protein phosphatase PrpC
MLEQDGEISLMAFGQTDVGRVRQNNEDAFTIADLTAGQQGVGSAAVRYRVGACGVLLAVSDGMGGAEAGEVASALVIESLRNHLGNDCDARQIQESMRRAVELANRDVWLTARQTGRLGMGATLVAALVHKMFAYIATVGDSRAYIIRKNGVCQITRDQSYVEMLVETGLITRAQAEAHPQRNIILQAMGHRPEVTVALGRLELRSGDLLLLCSDGLSKKVSDADMADVIRESPSFQSSCERLIALANARGGEDNITAVLAQVTGTALAAPKHGEAIKDTLVVVSEFKSGQ